MRAPLTAGPACGTGGSAAHVADRVADAAVPHDDPLRGGTGGVWEVDIRVADWCRARPAAVAGTAAARSPATTPRVAADRLRVLLNMVCPFVVVACRRV